MARLGKPVDRRSWLPVIAVAGVLGAAGTTVVLNQLPREQVTAAGAVATVGKVFGNGFEGEGGGASVPTTCPAPPAGFNRVSKTWAQLWAWGYPCGRMELCERNLRSYSAGQSYPAPIGAQRGTYTMVPFVAQPGFVNLYFDLVQSRPQIGYSQRPANGMLLSISKCAGDVEGKAMPSPWCHVYAASASLRWSTGAEQYTCPVVAGEAYFLHLIPANPAGGITPGETTCANVPASSRGCDVGARVQSAVK